MALIDGEMMSSKFRGCLLGALLGDCLGYPYEYRKPATGVELNKFFDNLEDPSYEAPTLEYSDDTAMTKCNAASLIEKREIDVSDLSKRYVTEYFKRPGRGYGRNVVDVFEKLRQTNCEDPFVPAREQFGGSGSYGNGGAMRIAPIALFFRGQSSHSLADFARKASLITHTHINGIRGAILQCLAIDQALWLNPKEPLNTQEFLERLIDKMQVVEEKDKELGVKEDPQPFCSKLRWASELLEKEKNGTMIHEHKDVLERLKVGVAALNSVPTAIFCFLRAQQGQIPNIEAKSVFRRTVMYAISLGRDTDTIASMAGAICGAYYGYNSSEFNENLMKHCEGVEEALEEADKLYSNSSPCTIIKGR